MGETSLAVEIRAERGKGPARRLRVAGRIPGVVYGGKHESVAISLDPKQLDTLIRTSHAGVNTLIDLDGAAEVAGRTVLVKELQRDPVLGQLIHADLFEIDPDARVIVSVPVHLTGTALGVTLGGLLDHALRVVELSCLASAIPDEITVDVTDLELGNSVHASDLVLPLDVELHSNGDIPVVSVVAPRVEEEAAAVDEVEGEAVAAGEAPAADGAAAGESAEGGDGDK